MKKIFLLLVLITAIFGSSIFAAEKIDTTAEVNINGIRQFISIKGADAEKPVLLFLHGGPGRSLIPFAESFTKQLLQKFVVVQWDQRETGQTLAMNSSPQKITVELMKSDALAMVQYLLRRFKQNKLYLVSHSWGSVMGFDIAYKHPELLYAYVPISPMVDATKSARLTVRSLKEWAEKNKNNTAIKELAAIKIPYQTEQDLYYSQKWLFVHNEVDGAESEAFRNIFYKWMAVWYPVWKENAATSLFITTPEIKCPIYFFEGSGDNQTYYTVAADYYKFLKAKRKKLIWFKKSGHTIYNSEPEKIEQELIDTVLKETYTSNL